jgi:predicted methyltransferase
MGFEEFFIKLFEDKNLLEHLERKALLVEDEFPEFKEMHNRKIELFAELNKLVIELYQISPVSMDYNKLTQGEEGVVTYFEIEGIKSKKTKERDSYVDTKRIDVELTEQIVCKLNEVAIALQNIS